MGRVRSFVTKEAATLVHNARGTKIFSYFALTIHMLANARQHYMHVIIFFQKSCFTAWFGTDLFIVAVVERSKDITHVKLLPSLVAKICDVNVR